MKSASILAAAAVAALLALAACGSSGGGRSALSAPAPSTAAPVTEPLTTPAPTTDRPETETTAAVDPTPAPTGAPRSIKQAAVKYLEVVTPGNEIYAEAEGLAQVGKYREACALMLEPLRTAIAAFAPIRNGPTEITALMAKLGPLHEAELAACASCATAATEADAESIWYGELSQAQQERAVISEASAPCLVCRA
jgi:hypothetical protein